MKRVLVTGASGFIGRHCLRPLRERDYKIHVLSHRAEEMFTDVVCHQTNIFSSTEIRQLMIRVRPTHLLHLAWDVTPGNYLHSLDNYHWLRSSIYLAEQFSAVGGQRSVVTGTCFEYDYNYGYCVEGLTPLAPKTPYAVCKDALRRTLESLYALNQVSGAWGRVFYLYGPYEYQTRLVPSVILSLLQNLPANCTHGKQLRDFMHVADVASGLVALLDSNLEGDVNIASGQPVSIKDLVMHIGAIMGRVDMINMGARSAPPNEPLLLFGNNDKLCSTSWRPNYDLDKGLCEVVEWWRKNWQSQEAT